MVTRVGKTLQTGGETTGWWESYHNPILRRSMPVDIAWSWYTSPWWEIIRFGWLFFDGEEIFQRSSIVVRHWQPVENFAVAARGCSHDSRGKDRWDAQLTRLSIVNFTSRLLRLVDERACTQIHFWGVCRWYLGGWKILIPPQPPPLHARFLWAFKIMLKLDGVLLNSNLDLCLVNYFHEIVEWNIDKA